MPDLTALLRGLPARAPRPSVAPRVLAGWQGWCSPCGTERPLVLTEVGPRGLRAWMSGHGAEDRDLGLYCRVCGDHQVVPLDEADDPAAPVDTLLRSVVRVGTSSAVLARGTSPEPASVVPTSALPLQRAADRGPSSLELPARVVDLDGSTRLLLAAAGWDAA